MGHSNINGIIAQIDRQWSGRGKRTKSIVVDPLGNVTLKFDDGTALSGPATSSTVAIEDQILEASRYIESDAPWNN